jgi:hypothetical protein
MDDRRALPNEDVAKLRLVRLRRLGRRRRALPKAVPLQELNA